MIGRRSRGGQEMERLVHPVAVVIFDSGGNNESCLSLALNYECEKHREHAHLVDLSGYYVPHL